MYKDYSHGAKSVNQGTPSIWVGYAEGHPIGTYQIFNPKKKKIALTWDMTFLQRSYGEYTKVEKPAVVTKSYEGSDEEEELKMVPIVINNKSVNIVSDSESDSSKDSIKNNDDNFFDNDINDQVKMTPQNNINAKDAKVVWAMKNLQALYDDNAKKIFNQAKQEKSVIKNLNLLINLAMVISNTKPVPDEPKSFI